MRRLFFFSCVMLVSCASLFLQTGHAVTAAPSAATATLVAASSTPRTPAPSAAAAPAVVNFSSGAGSVRVDISFEGSSPAISEAGNGTRVTLQGCMSGSAPGYPDLPVYILRVEIPADMRVGRIDYSAIETIDLGTGLKISPTPFPVSTADTVPAAAREVKFDGSGWFPVTPARVSGEGFLRDHRIASLLIYPVQYKDSEGRLTFDKKMSISLQLVPDTKRPLERKRVLPASDREVESVLKAVVANPSTKQVTDAVTPLAAPKDPFQPSFRPSLDGSPVQYVIITNETMLPEFQRLADWKTKSGVSTVVRTVSWIRQNYVDGCDVPETIRKFIRDAYTNWGTTWVLLGGDSDVIPPRYGWSTYTGGEAIPTDLYYQCLDGNWNADGDKYFGEGYYEEVLPGDDADLYPEVWVGRATVNTLEEAHLFVDKILGYEKDPPANYVTKSLFFSEVLFPKEYIPSGTKCDTVSLDGAEISQTAIPYLPPSFHTERLYENYLCFPGSIRETKQGILDSLNTGYGLAQHVGHGYRNTLSVGDGTMSNADIDGLVNGSKIGVLIAENCTSAAFDFNCIGERFILNSNGGAVCYIGSTRFDYPTTAWAFQDELYRLMFQAHVTRVGQALALSKVPFISLSIYDDSFRWTQFVLIELGDPTLPIWTGEPETLNVAYSSEMVAGSPYFQVDVTSLGLPVDSALVCLWKVNEDYKTGYTDADGTVRIPFAPDTQGTFTVTVTKQDFRPFEGTAQVLAASAPYVRVYGKDVVDDSNGWAFGNGDGKIDAGEAVQLSMVLKNFGGSVSHGVTAVVRTDNSFATFIDSTAAYGEVPAGAVVYPDTAFLVHISRDCPPERDIVCTLEARDSADSVWTDQFVLKVYAPILWQASNVVVDTLPGGNRNGEVNAGEQIEYIVTLKNLGVGSANQVVGHLSTLDPSITILDSLSVFNSIPSCSSSTGDEFRFVCTNNFDNYLSLRLTDTLGLNQIMMPIEFTIPNTPLGLLGTGSSSSISLQWDPSYDGDLLGYNVYRSLSPSGPYQKVNEYVVEKISYFMDDGLLPYTKYYYKVAAQDSSANQSPLSGYVFVTTNPPLHVNAPFELGEQLTSSSPAIVDLDRNGTLEIVAGSNKIYAFEHDGSEYIDGDHDVLTLGVFSPIGEKFSCSPAAGDIDNDDSTEVVCVDWNLRQAFVWRADGTVAPGWPQSVGVNPWSTPAIADIDGDGLQEIVVGNADGRVYAWNPDGSEVIDGDNNPSTKGVFAVTGSAWLYGSAALVDIDEDGVAEVIIGGRDGKLYAWDGNGAPVPHFPYVAGGFITSSPAVADIDEDGAPEIVFGAGNNQVYAINTDSTLVPGWPKTGVTLTGDMQPSPAIGDLDADGKLDVITGSTNGYVYAWRGYNGQAIPGWPVRATSLGSQCSPTLGDIDGDGRLEVLFGAEDGRLYGWNHDGTEAAGFPIQLSGEVRGPALIWDIDGDGYVNVICQDWDKTVYVWDMLGQFTYSRASFPWPMFRHDVTRSGFYTKSILTSVELSSFVAKPSEIGVVLEWNTNVDDTLAAQWNIYRKELSQEEQAASGRAPIADGLSGSVPAGYVKVNSEPVRPVTPYHYSFTDRSAEGGKWYSYYLARILKDGEMLFGPYVVYAPAPSVPLAPALAQNFPNPFQPLTMISFSVPAGKAGSPALMQVAVRIFDVTGRCIKTLVDGPKAPGFYSIRWNATDDGGMRVAGGVYFVKAQIGDYTASKKMVVLD